MKKQQTKHQRKALILERESIKRLDDENLSSIAGGCNGMPFSCTCPTIP